MEFDDQRRGAEGFLTAQTRDFEDYCVIQDAVLLFLWTFHHLCAEKTPTDFVFRR